MSFDPSNTVQRQQCMLVLDASDSMNTRDTDSAGTRIELLNDGIKTFVSELRRNKKALVRAQIAVVVVGGAKDDARLMLDWTDGEDFEPFPLKVGNKTPLGAGVLLALEKIEEQKKVLSSHGITYFRPWLFVMTDGEPTDAAGTWQTACRTALDYESRNKVLIYSIGIGECNLTKLGQLSTEPPRRLSAADFQKLFNFIPSSIGAGRLGPDPWVGVRPESRPDTRDSVDRAD